MLRDEMPDEGERRGASLALSTIVALPPVAIEIAGHPGFESQEDGARKRGAKIAMTTIRTLPPAPIEIAGHCPSGNHGTHARKRRGAITPPATRMRVPPVAPITEIGGGGVASGGEGQTTHGAPLRSALASTLDRLRALQRQRQFCIVSQSRCDRSAEAFIARVIGYSADADEKARKELFKRASDFRREVEKAQGGEGHLSDGGQAGAALAACVPIVINSAIARGAWDGLRDQAEKEMRRLARTLPGYAWVQSVKGFGDLGFAIIVAETGDMAGYATKERVWKRLGLAVISGIRQQRRSGAEEAAAHGYSPKRRSEVWTIADSMFRQQWRGAKDDAPAQAAGVYGEVYGRRKAHTATREWTPKHRDNDARRIMAKRLIEDLWRVWNGKAPLGSAEREETP